MRNLPETTTFGSPHEFREDVATAQGRFFETAESGRGLGSMSLLVIREPLNAQLFFFLRGASEIGGRCERCLGWVARLVGVYPYQREVPGVFGLFVLE